MSKFTNRQGIYIFDLDGTIALNEHRQHYVQRPRGEKDWESFHKECVNDLPNQPIITIMQLLAGAGHIVAILSGRMGSVKSETIAWLEAHKVSYHYFEMRPIDNHVDDCILKKEMMERLRARFFEHEVGCVFEDRKKVVDMWRANGLKCFQVAPGEF